MTRHQYSFYYENGNRITAKRCTRDQAEEYAAELADELGESVELWRDDPEQGLDDKHLATYDPD